jgi:hypothetical protein
MTAGIQYAINTIRQRLRHRYDLRLRQRTHKAAIGHSTSQAAAVLDEVLAPIGTERAVGHWIWTNRRAR